MEKLKKIAQSYFEQYTDEDTVFITSDGTPFSKENKRYAEAHDKAGITVFRKEGTTIEVATKGDAIDNPEVKALIEDAVKENTEKFVSATSELKAKYESEITALQNTTTEQVKSYDDLNQTHIKTLAELEAVKAELETLKAKKK